MISSVAFANAVARLAGDAYPYQPDEQARYRTSTRTRRHFLRRR